MALQTLLFRLAMAILAASLICCWFSSTDEKRREEAKKIGQFDADKDDSVSCVMFSPDGKMIVAGTQSGMIWLWDTHKANDPQKFQVSTDNLLTGGILCLAVSPDGKRLLVGCADNMVRLVDTESAKVIRVLKGHGGPVWSVAFLNHGRTGLSGSTVDESIRAWNLEDGKEMYRVNGDDRIDRLAVSPDETSFLNSDFKKFQLRDSSTGKLTRSFEGHATRVKGAFFLPDSSRIVSSDADGIVLLWDAKTGRSLRTILERELSVDTFSVSPDGHRALLGCVNEARLVDLVAGEEILCWNKLKGATRVAFSPDGSFALIGETRGPITLWELPKTANKKWPWEEGNTPSDKDRLVPPF